MPSSKSTLGLGISGFIQKGELFIIWKQRINPSIAAPAELEKTNTSIELIGDTLVYQYPNKNASLGTIRPLTITPFEKTHTGWYHIHSDLGDGWVQVDENNLPQKIDELINLQMETALWSTPISGGWLAKLAPQQVRAYEKWNNWYKIHTWLGEAWVNLAI